MDITEEVNKLDDDDLILLLKVLSCPDGQEQDIYFKERKKDDGKRIGSNKQ
jgi:hypothetical protein